MAILKRDKTILHIPHSSNYFPFYDGFISEESAINESLAVTDLFGHADNIAFTTEQKALLDKVHKEKIDNSDAIFVIDVGGYIGDSTQSEIDYAIKKGKDVEYLSKSDDYDFC